MKKSLPINLKAVCMILVTLVAFMVTGCGDSGGGGAPMNGPLVSATLSANTIALGGSITGTVTSNADMTMAFLMFFPVGATTSGNFALGFATDPGNSARSITMTFTEQDGVKGTTEPGVQLNMVDGFMWNYFLQNPTDTKFSAFKMDANYNMVEGPFATDIPALVLVVQ